MQDLKLGTKTLAGYLKAFKAIFDGLAAIQKAISEDNTAIYLLHALGPRYNVLVTTMLAKPPLPYTHNLSQLLKVPLFFGWRLP